MAAPLRPLDLPDMSGLSILVVEDDYDSLEITTTVLKACGATVAGARNTSTALAYLRVSLFRAVISDLKLPNGDGLDLIRTIRQTHDPGQLPAIAITGYWDEYPGALEAGFNALLRKPVDISQLGKTLAGLLGR